MRRRRDDILAVRARDLLEDVETPHVVDFGAIAATQLLASSARNASQVVYGSGVVSVGANAGSSPSNAPKASGVPDPPALRTKLERVDRAGNWWTTYWGGSSFSSSPRGLVGGSSESSRGDLGSGCCCSRGARGW